MKGKISLAVSVCLFLAIAVRAQTAVSVSEAETRAFFAGNQLQISLILENKAVQIPADINAEILDENDKIIARGEKTATLEKGKNAQNITLNLTEKPSVNKMLWYRLRYTVAARTSSPTGIVSLSEIMPELFELRVAASAKVFAGQKYTARVYAFHPTKFQAISGIKLDAEIKLELDGDEKSELKVTAAGATNADGLATLEFQIPPDAKLSGGYGSGEIKVTGEKNQLKGFAEDDLRGDKNEVFVFINTDKPLYQPNQKIYIRGLALQKDFAKSARQTVAGSDLEFRIKDEDNTVLFRETVKSSRFGIAAIEWQIPDNAKLGTYEIEVKADNEDNSGTAQFKVSRYELPQFIVKIKPDKDFYLPGENTAKVAVDALYLFGKPIEKGTVKIVRESERRWNYKEQKFDVTEEETYAGALGADGKYTAEIDLSKARGELTKDEDEQFADLNFTAYLTDASTNRTEQKRFDLRVTKEPIQVYLIGKRYDDQNPKMPVEFYVSTFSADGKPLVCNVEIKGKYDDEEEYETFQTLARVKTNAFGAARVEFRLPRPKNDYFDDLKLKIIARDQTNRVGTKDEEVDVDEDEEQIVLRTEKAVYKTGEPLEIEIAASEKNEIVFVDVLKNYVTVESRQIKLTNGRGKLEISYNSSLKGALTVLAYFDDDGNAVSDSKGIIYPTPKNLRVNINSDRKVFRPAEEAKLDFTVAAPGKAAGENALGVFILDRAVEERAFTDDSFGGGAINPLADFADLLGYSRSFGGLTENDLNELDLNKPISKDMQLAAEVMFKDSYFKPNFFEGRYSKNLQNVFSAKIEKQFAPVRKVLNQQYQNTYEHPTDEASLKRILREGGIDFDSLRDPWGGKYYTVFSINQERDAVSIKSHGADKILDDADLPVLDDDFTALDLNFNYFPPIGNQINQAVAEFQQQTGKFVRDESTLRQVLAKQDFNLDNLKDRWGESYKIEFGVEGRYFTIDFRSGNSDRKITGSYDDFIIWTMRTDYFAAPEARIEAILNNYIREKQTFPKTEAELKAILKVNGVDFDSLRDGWNRPFYIETETISRFVDRVNIEAVAAPNGKTEDKLTITPVTRKLGTIKIRSFGEDGKKAENNYYNGDPVIATFAGIVSEQIKDDGKPKIIVPKTAFVNGKAAIFGTVYDQNQAVIPNADIVITNLVTKIEYQTKANAEGVYLRTNLAAGKYSVKGSASGFKSLIVTEISVAAENLTETNLTLEVGAINETVTIISDSSVSIDPTNTTVDENISRSIINDLPKGTQFTSLLKIAPNGHPEPLAGGFQIDGASGAENTFVIDNQEVTNFRSGQLNENDGLPNQEKKETPRLREYFPETLLWQPEIVTDANGNAQLKFKLADNITTWKIYAIASNEEGNVGIASKEIKAFQPFFVDLMPPRFLTVGDEIYLPTQIRNYTATRQKVNVEIAKSNWFSLLDASAKQIEVDSNTTGNATFGFRADRRIDDGTQKVTAIADTDSDAIEKLITVKPNGREIIKTESEIFTGSINFAVDFPANALPETQSAELKIYPNLLAHVAESVEGLLQRPYGCGEQTVSSTYPNLMILKFTKDGNKLRPPARKFLQKGYERLLGYQVAGGGFSYWGGKDEASIALTAYAIRFLNDAGAFIEVDEAVVKNAQAWLISQQQTDGGWTKKYAWETIYDKRRTWQITTYVTKTLAMTERGKAEKSKAVQESLQKAFAFLRTANIEIDEPYALANFGLALLDAGDLANAETIAEKLRTMAVSEGSAIYWNLETNTPFYGWGTAGRIETTALVVQLLIRIENESKTKVRNPKSEDLISRAALFLLKNKDRYGVWHSTQTTINVLDALLALLSGAANEKNENRVAEIFVNNQKIKEIKLPPFDELSFPQTLDISENLAARNNKIEIKIDGNQTTVMAQIVRTHYISWQDSTAEDAADINQSRQLALEYNCDKLNAQPTEEITCQVKAERVGFRGYGMLLAEIGIPPGAEVDRASLEKAKNEDWSLSRYDVLPDRIVVYLWSRAGGTNFNFKFKPRYAINAQTPASIIYDYYNDEAKATLPPLKFTVK